MTITAAQTNLPAIPNETNVVTIPDSLYQPERASVILSAVKRDSQQALIG